MAFVTGSDPLVAAAFATGAAALAVSAALLVAILVLRLRLAARAARTRRFAERWQPLFAACAFGVPESVPALAARDGVLFLSLWLGAQESLRGEAQLHLNALARRVGADRFVGQCLASGNRRHEMLALVAAGHLRMEGIRARAEALAAGAPPAVALAAAQALLRIDPRRALPGVLALAALREDWPAARCGAMLRDCDPGEAGAALAAAIDAERVHGRIHGLVRLLRLHRALAAEAARPAVHAVLRGVEDPEAIAAALNALWHPEDAELARARVGHGWWQVRLAAAKVLGRIGDAADRPTLEALLGDPSWWVRYRSAQALARLPGVDRAALAALRAAHKDRFAADMLGQILSESEAA